MAAVKTIKIEESIFADNDASAKAVREMLTSHHTTMLNVMSAPGSGKTTLLTAVIGRLSGEMKIRVMDVDIESTLDAQRVADATGVEALQIHNGGLCHIDADMVSRALSDFAPEDSGILDDTDLLILENIGNLVCPAEFDTGAAIKMTILSVPEGDDKPAKYPLMYEECDIMAVNKIDTLPVFDFDKEKAEQYAKYRNPDIRIFYISARTGEGIESLAEEIITRVQDWNA